MSPSISESRRVLVADAISEKGIEQLRSVDGIEVDVRTGLSGPELQEIIGGYDALIVRSATKVTSDVLRSPGRLRAIGRAGTGVDNIDLDAATRAGVVVMNTPGGNSVAAAELTMSLLLALARNVPQANADLRDGRWERKRYTGAEVAGKTLGIVGLGRIGREVARRALGFRMQVVGYDPFVSAKAATDFGIEGLTLDELVSRSDFVTLHIPMSEETRHLFDAELIAKMRPGARLINCARGGLVDEAALLSALESGHLAGAALDVFENEPPGQSPLVAHPAVVSTPHLGASTREAQERVGTEIAAKVLDYLATGTIVDAVNFPAIAREDLTALQPVMELAERLGRFLGPISEGGFKRFEVRAFGTYCDLSLRPLVMAATRGLMAGAVDGGVSYVNALSLAEERGVTVDEGRSSETSPYSGLLRLTVDTEHGSTTVAGTLFGEGHPRLVEVDGVAIESRPDGRLLFLRNRDVPGVVGKVGTILGRAGVNIAGIQLGRPRGSDAAVSIIKVDGEVSDAAFAELRKVPEILLVRSLIV